LINRAKRFTIYDQGDGLPDQKTTARRMYYDRDSGNIYLGSNEYISTFPFVPATEADQAVI
jgi:hypothetical protein